MISNLCVSANFIIKKLYQDIFVSNVSNYFKDLMACKHDTISLQWITNRHSIVIFIYLCVYKESCIEVVESCTSHQRFNCEFLKKLKFLHVWIHLSSFHHFWSSKMREQTLQHLDTWIEMKKKKIHGCFFQTKRFFQFIKVPT